MDSGSKVTPYRAFRESLTLRNLQLVFEQRIANTATRGRDGVSARGFQKHLGREMRVIRSKMWSGTYRFTAYRERLVLKGAGRAPRQISVPTVRDRIALRALADFLSRTFPHSKGEIPQAKIERIVGDLASGRYSGFVKIDVENFYPSIDHAILIDEIKRRVRKEEIIAVVKRAIETPTIPDGKSQQSTLWAKGVPQGLSISNRLAEIYIRPLDDLGSSISGASYYRFVDDILVLCDRTYAEEIREACGSALKDLGLEAHESKGEIGNTSDGFDYLGYKFEGSTVSVREKSRLRLERRLERIHAEWRTLTRERSGSSRRIADQRLVWQRNLAITGCIYRGTPRGWLQYFRQLNDLRMLKQLDATVIRLGRRYNVTPELRAKTFVRAYWAIAKPRLRGSSYIPNFDRYTVCDMRSDLIYLGELSDGSNCSDQEVKEKFFRVVSRAVRDLEHDIGDLS